MKIIPFEERYRDDLIFMILQAKDALGRKPGLNEDLLDIKSHYFDKGGRFWIAIDENDRVIGSVGYMRVNGTNEAFLHRLFVKAAEKHKGIGTALLKVAEECMKNNKILVSKVHLGTPKEDWFESYSFYPKHGYVEYEERYMKKLL
ncbi:acetyltransferase, GNAT family [Catonella morbi ATCC 51271]|uniref:Acetyltransferase, GNAT family n=1 Tax=Catonella morbi ATCC 51271 TaxID=592026 RepID=V2Y245_9FIRM|nr:GNAT family N-acetyltransferase [Catonella morbi]ESL02137.1 acetyltransferase, GNAT family [Catonella morbi ATCC 51271]